jgi:hypothetical protein
MHLRAYGLVCVLCTVPTVACLTDADETVERVPKCCVEISVVSTSGNLKGPYFVLTSLQLVNTTTPNFAPPCVRPRPDLMCVALAGYGRQTKRPRVKSYECILP